MFFDAPGQRRRPRTSATPAAKIVAAATKVRARNEGGGDGGGGGGGDQMLTVTTASLKSESLGTSSKPTETTLLFWTKTLILLWNQGTYWELGGLSLCHPVMTKPASA